MPSQVVDKLTRDELRSRQERQLRERANAVIPKNAFWTRRFAAAGVAADSLKSLEDLARLPLTAKSALIEDQIACPPYGSNLTGPPSQFCRLHQTSGTTAVPLRWLDTAVSWNWVVSCWEQIYQIVGVTPSDVVAFPFSFGPFLGFWAAFDGAYRIGALCLPGGGLTSQARLHMIRDNLATIVCCTPTYALRLADVAKEERFDLAKTGVRAVVVAG